MSLNEDNAEKLLDLLGKVAAAAAAGVYTLTYATPAREVPEATAAGVATDSSTADSPYGYSQAQADAIPAAINALEADVLALKQVVVALVTDLETAGIVTPSS